MENFPKGESIESEHDKKIWWWKECIDDATKSGLKMATNEFWVFYKLRVYETHGRYGFSVASAQTLADDIGITVRQVEVALMHLRQEGKIFHVICDKKVYRNKTRIDVTNKWCEKWNVAPDKYLIGNKGKRTGGELGNVAETEPKSSETEPKSSETEPQSSETEPQSSETEPQSSETEPQSSESPLMNKYKNKSKKNSTACGSGIEDRQQDNPIDVVIVERWGYDSKGDWKKNKTFYTTVEEADKIEEAGENDYPGFDYWASRGLVGGDRGRKTMRGYKKTCFKLSYPEPDGEKGGPKVKYQTDYCY